MLNGFSPPGPKYARIAGFELHTPAAERFNHKVNPVSRSPRGTRRPAPVPLLPLPERHAQCTPSPPHSAPQTPCCRASPPPDVICQRLPRGPRPLRAHASSACAAAAPAAAAATTATTAGSSMGFSCAPPCVWPSPGSRGASCRGAIAAARGRIAGRGLQGERRRRRQPSPTGGLGLGNCLRLHGQLGEEPGIG